MVKKEKKDKSKENEESKKDISNEVEVSEVSESNNKESKEEDVSDVEEKLEEAEQEVRDDNFKRFIQGDSNISPSLDISFNQNNQNFQKLDDLNVGNKTVLNEDKGDNIENYMTFNDNFESYKKIAEQNMASSEGVEVLNTAQVGFDENVGRQREFVGSSAQSDRFNVFDEMMNATGVSSSVSGPEDYDIIKANEVGFNEEVNTMPFSDVKKSYKENK